MEPQPQAEPGVKNLKRLLSLMNPGSIPSLIPVAGQETDGPIDFGAPG